MALLINNWIILNKKNIPKATDILLPDININDYAVQGQI